MSLVLVSLLTRFRLKFRVFERRLIRFTGNLHAQKALIYEAYGWMFRSEFFLTCPKKVRSDFPVCSLEGYLVQRRAFWISSNTDNSLTLFSSPVFISFKRTLSSLISPGPRTRHILTFNESAYSSCLPSGRCLRS